MKALPMIALAGLLVTGSALATDAAAPAHAATSTASAAKPDHHCKENADAKKLAGAARKSFIKKCLADARAAK